MSTALVGICDTIILQSAFSKLAVAKFRRNVWERTLDVVNTMTINSHKLLK